MKSFFLTILFNIILIHTSATSSHKSHASRATSLLRGTTLIPTTKTDDAIKQEEKIRSLLHQQAGSIHTILLTRSPGQPVLLGMKLRHGHIDDQDMEVEAVDVGSSADLAGILKGDIIKSPKSPLELKQRIASAATGTGTEEGITFQIERDDGTETKTTKSMNMHLAVQLDIVSFGLGLSTTTRSDGKYECPVFEIASITSDSLASKATPKLAIGDVVLAVNGIPAPSQQKMVERLLGVSARVILTIFKGEFKRCQRKQY